MAPHHDRRAKLIGARIRAARTARGLSLTALAEGAGVDISQLSRIERGAGRTSLEVYERIGAIVGLTPAQVLLEQPTTDAA